jgi:hypothetical protein
MRQGIQTNFKHPVIRAWGCCYLTLLRMIELNDVRVFKDDDEIISLWNECVNKGWISESNSFIKNDVSVVNHCAGSKLITRILRQQSFPDSKFFMAHISKPGITEHFVAMGQNRCIWDSWTPSAQVGIDSGRFPVLNYRTFIIS